MKILQTILISGISLLLFFSVAFPADNGGYAGAFLRMGLGARPKALGGAFTAVAEGSFGGYYNPGGLPRNLSREFTFSYRSLALDRNFNYIGFVLPLNPKTKTGEKVFNAGLHLGWIHAGVDHIEGRDYSGYHYTDFSSSENAFSFGFAVQPMPLISIGFCGKILYNRFPKVTREDEALSSKGLGFDVGILITPIPKLAVGILIKDLRSKNTWNTEKVWERGTTTYDEYPTIFRIGVAYRLLNDRLLVTADFEDNKKQPEKFHFGVEYLPVKTVFLRGGLDVTEPAFGLGYLFKIWKFDSILDYTYAFDDVAPSAEHIFSWAFRF